MLKLSQKYLKEVCTEKNYKKIRFVSAENPERKKTDLIINIDSLQEMNKKIVKDYLNFIDLNAKYFFCKNTVGKFDPSVGGFEKSEDANLALRSGLLTEIINIFSPKDLESAQKKFLSSFLPGKNWTIEKHSTCSPWSHYYQALYGTNKNG